MIFGLTASVWTRDLTRALNYTDRLQAGTVWVNSHTLIDANLPFGGMKQSGTGRDFGPDWLDDWCENQIGVRALLIFLSDGATLIRPTVRAACL